MLANSEHFNEIREEAVQLLKYINEMDISEITKAVKRITAYKLEINGLPGYHHDMVPGRAAVQSDKG